MCIIAITVTVSMAVGWGLCELKHTLTQRHKYRHSYLLPWYKILWGQLRKTFTRKKRTLPF